MLFSTHILSDVERICTDVAVLHNGVASLQGKLADIKSRYSSHSYYLEIQTPKDATSLAQILPQMKVMSPTQLVFSEKDYALHQVLEVLTSNRTPILKIERIDPTLETLFMEVIEQ